MTKFRSELRNQTPLAIKNRYARAIGSNVIQRFEFETDNMQSLKRMLTPSIKIIIPEESQRFRLTTIPTPGFHSQFSDAYICSIDQARGHKNDIHFTDLDELVSGIMKLAESDPENFLRSNNISLESIRTGRTGIGYRISQGAGEALVYRDALHLSFVPMNYDP